MRNRRFAIAVLLVLVATAFFLPPVYWRVVGWAKGEAFYDGRPTCWWEREVETSYCSVQSRGFPLEPRVPPFWWTRAVVPTWNQFLPTKFQQPVRFEPKPPLLNGEVDALPVLVELLHSRDRTARLVALCGLGELGEAAKCSLPEIVHMSCDDLDPEIQAVAFWARDRILDELSKPED